MINPLFHPRVSPGKTRTHCGGNIANVIMFPKCWLVLPRAQHLSDTHFVSWTHKMFLRIFRNICCVRAARNNVVAFCRGRATSQDTMLPPRCVLVLPGPKEVYLSLLTFPPICSFIPRVTSPTWKFMPILLRSPLPPAWAVGARECVVAAWSSREPSVILVHAEWRTPKESLVRPPRNTGTLLRKKKQKSM